MYKLVLDAVYGTDYTCFIYNSIQWKFIDDDNNKIVSKILFLHNIQLKVSKEIDISEELYNLLVKYV